MAPIDGYWGKGTSTLDWCEENYVTNYYIAEFWNTLSNITFIIAPLVMVVIGLKENHEKRSVYSFISIMVVGVGSWMFHMTLLYSMQLMDEIPMIWGSSFLIYSFYMVQSKPDEDNIPLQIFLFVYCLVVTVVYVSINAPIFHQTCYGLMVFSMIFLALKTVLTFPNCNKTLFVVAISTYATGFLFWNIDNQYCDNLKYFRRQLNDSSGMLLQLHAWWHVFAGIGTYMSLLFAVHTRYLHLKRNPSLKCFCGVLPYVTIADTGASHLN